MRRGVVVRGTDKRGSSSCSLHQACLVHSCLAVTPLVLERYQVLLWDRFVGVGKFGMVDGCEAQNSKNSSKDYFYSDKS